MFSLSTISIRTCSIAIVSVALIAHSIYPQLSRHLSPPSTWIALFWLKPLSPHTPASWKPPWRNQAQGYQPVFLAYGSARHNESMKMLGHGLQTMGTRVGWGPSMESAKVAIITKLRATPRGRLYRPILLTTLSPGQRQREARELESYSEQIRM